MINTLGIKVKSASLAMLLLIQFAPFAGASVVIENKYFRYEVSRDGINLHFFDKATGTDYLCRDTVSHCASMVQDGKTFNVTSGTFMAGRLLYTFGKTGVTAELLVRKYKDHMILEVAGVKGTAESLTFLNIPLTLEGMPHESFAACALALNLSTQVKQLPALQTHLRATSYQRFGMKGASASLLGVPQKEILIMIRKVMVKARDIPLSTAGGAWAQLGKEGYGSYLMNFGTLTEETVPEWIQMCTDLGFNQVDNHEGGSFYKFGDFELNPEIWPEGWAQFKRINERLHQAGISSIFHTYAFFIDKNSKYVTPVPHPDLGYFSSFTLAAPIGPDDTEIPVLESTAGISTLTGFFVRNSLTLRIGDEPVRLRIELLMSVKPYDNPGNVVLAGSDGSADSLSRESAAGVTGGIFPSADKTETGDAVFNFEAFSSVVSPRESAWIRMEKIFEPWLDLEKNQALGVWINGDGNGELLNLRLESPKHLSYGARGDHFVKIDFTGWKFFELVEIESSESSDYIWPAPNTTSDFYVYDSYRHTVDFKHVDKLQFWYIGRGA